MDQPWRRINEILNTSAHPTRTTEHIVYVRMLQRSKNQHRHGLYYRRLQHVQRLLRDINDHPAWDLLEKSDSVNRGNTDREHADKKTLSRSKKERNKHTKTTKKENEILSTSAKDKIETLINLMETLVEQVIPQAARSIVIHLIALGQFLPYAITMCACLARIFVAERTLRNELRIILRDINVLLVGKTLDYTSMNGEEDIGIAVCDEENRQENAKAEHDYDSKTDISQFITGHQSDQTSDKQHDTTESSSRKASRPDKESEDLRHEKDAEAPSLFDIMAETGVPQNMLDEIVANAGALHTDAVQHISGTDNNSNNSAKTKRNRKRKRKKGTLATTQYEKRQKFDGEKADVEQMTNPVKTMATNSHPMHQNKVTPSRKELPESSKDKSFKGSDKNIKKLSNSKHIVKERSASDSEDIDDIFGDLN